MPVGFAPATQAIQQAVVSGQPTGGTFTLTFAGQTTAPIAHDANAATVQAALEALSNIAPGDVVVTTDPNGVHTVAFAGVYAGLPVSLMTADGTLLTGGSSPGANVALVANPAGSAGVAAHFTQPTTNLLANAGAPSQTISGSPGNFGP